MIRVAIAGIGGRMGGNVAALVHRDVEMTLAGGVIRPASSVSIDQVRNTISDPAWSGTIVESPEEILANVDVLIDFTNPNGTIEMARACRTSGTALVSGTTGLGQEQFTELQTISRHIPVFYAANLSVGVSTILEMLPALARALRGYDIEIVETHHSRKVDAPSGTALRLAEALTEPINQQERNLVYGREGMSPRQPGEIGIHAVRAGGNTGEHTIIFATDDEQVEITHRSYNRLGYARGAVQAARRIAGESAGFFTTSDLIS